VVKVAPPGVAPVGHRDVLRQARIIRALGPTPVPVPEVMFEDPGDPPDIPPLFGMSRLSGACAEPLFDAPPGDTEDVVAARFRSAVKAMAQLHRLSAHTLGLGSEPATGPSAEVERWSRTLETVDPVLVPGWRDVADGLWNSAPAGLAPALVHGDFRLGNLLADADRITAVIDWEIWSLGDPRVDVGWFLINADPETYQRDTPYAAAAPSADELMDLYSRELARDVGSLAWFRALACFKSTATWSLIVKHNRRRDTPLEDIERMAPLLPHLLSEARRLLG
jgi:aminoglycoside phosphotransferase (APT) family kinase protein